MRELKFRVWDGEEFMPLGIAIHKYEIIGVGLGIEHFYDRVSIEQYTGLKDKNGLTEIYEGDILKITNPDHQIQKIELIGIVEMGWFQWQVSVEIINRWEGYSVDKPVPGNYYLPLHVLKAGKMFEILGNVHQDSELLAGKTILDEK